MTNDHNAHHDFSTAMVYEIKIEGRLDTQWTDWFEGVTVTHEDDGNTRLTCEIIDQAALYGLLRKIRDLGTPLVSVNRIETDTVDTVNSNINHNEE